MTPCTSRCWPRRSYTPPLPTFSDQEIETLKEVDRCLRFFHLCSVLQDDLRLGSAILAKSYYWYATLFIDEALVPELREYIRVHYSRLFAWLTANEDNFKQFQKTGIWGRRRGVFALFRRPGG